MDPVASWIKKVGQGRQAAANFRQSRLCVLKISILTQNFFKIGDFYLQVLYVWKDKLLNSLKYRGVGIALPLFSTTPLALTRSSTVHCMVVLLGWTPTGHCQSEVLGQVEGLLSCSLNHCCRMSVVLTLCHFWYLLVWEIHKRICQGC